MHKDDENRLIIEPPELAALCRVALAVDEFRRAAESRKWPALTTIMERYRDLDDIVGGTAPETLAAWLAMAEDAR